MFIYNKNVFDNFKTTQFHQVSKCEARTNWVRNVHSFLPDLNPLYVNTAV